MAHGLFVAYLVLSGLAVLEALLIVLQTWEHHRFAWGRLSQLHSYRDAGRVVLIVPCKGIDVGLEKNLRSFFRQDYEDYEIRFVVERIRQWVHAGGSYDECAVLYRSIVCPVDFSEESRAALAGNPDNAELRFRLAFALESHGDINDAIKEYQAVLVRDPSYVWAYNNLGVPYAKKGLYEEAIGKFAPGWKVEGCGEEMEPGFYPELDGKKNVLVTHPLDQQTPCVISKKVAIPAGKRTILRTIVGHDPRGDWMLIVKADDKKLFSVPVSKDPWATAEVDLTEFAGKEINLQLLNQPTGWSFEAARWAKIEIESK